jgi:hypothetical protein
MVKLLRFTFIKLQLFRGLLPALVLCCFLLVPIEYSGYLNATPNATGREITPLDDDPRADYSKTDLRKGERLFRGLIPFESGTHDCSACHYTTPQEVINWNPSVYDLAGVWKNDKNYNLMGIMNSPVNMRLMTDHKGMTITRDEAEYLEAYLHEVNLSGKADLQAYPIKTVIFWGFGLLMALALIDLLITKKIKYHFIHLLILVVGLGTHAQYAIAAAQNLSRTPEYAPDQPIKFSHRIHSGENEIDCRYCHHIADNSKSAGIPSNNVCLNCHNVIRNGTLSGSFEINKIHKAVESGEPVKWVRVHNLPDHSFFSHAQHVNAGKLDCAECHGEVEKMHILRQVEDLSMGWCLTCHRTRKVDFVDNPYFQIYKQLHDDLKAGRIDSVMAARVGGEDCMKCHY